MMPGMIDDGNLLASDAERERAIVLLHDACGEGRLTLEEFSDRVSSVLAARTRGQLAPIVRDLPGPVPTGLAPLRRVKRLTVSLFSDVKRRGRWHLEGEHTAISVFGSCTLDLRAAMIAGEEVLIEAFVLFGALKVIVPEGTPIEMEGFAVFGSHGSKVDEDAVADSALAMRRPLVRVGGLTAFGAVEVVTN